jgi:glycosyltransferase involved in cell wall biosynthesis
MRIAILGTRGIPNRYGGFERFAEEISCILGSRGLEVFVTRPAANSGMEVFSLNVLVVDIPVSKLLPENLQTIAYDFLSLKWCLKNNIDVIVECGYAFSPSLLLLPRSIRNKIITNPDGLEYNRSKWGVIARLYLKLSEHLAFRYSAQIVCDNKALVDVYRKYNRKLNYIPYGAHPIGAIPNPDIVRKLSNFNHNEYYLVISRITPENSIELILNYFVGNKNRKLLVVGDTNSTYANKIRKVYGDYENITFLGGIYDQVVLNALRYHCKLYIHGHTAGGTNPSLLEAMACRCFILAHKNQFNQAVLGDDALYFSNANSLAERIDEFDCIEADTIESSKQRNFNKIKLYYSWEKVADEYEMIFNQIACLNKDKSKF